MHDGNLHIRLTLPLAFLALMGCAYCTEVDTESPGTADDLSMLSPSPSPNFL